MARGRSVLKVRRVGAVVLLFVVGTIQGAAAATPWYQTDFPPEEFKARWSAVFDRIGKDSVAVLQGMPQTDGFFFPRQTNDFYYLSGIETPGAYLLLDGRTRRVTLYLPPRNPRQESAEGKILSADDGEQVRSLTGVDEVLSTDAMRKDWLASRPEGAPKAIYTPLAPAEGAEQSRRELLDAHEASAADPWDGRIPREGRFDELLRARYWRSDVKDLSPILDQLRSVKSPSEIGLLRRAAQLAGMGILEAMRSTRPGIYEYQLDATARYIYLVNGAKLEGYRSIVSSGTDNIWNMHYYRNNKQLASDDVVLFDYAPEYRYYVSDIARMWPVNGKFPPVAREMLGFVWEYRQAILGRIRPGVTPAQILQEAQAAMEPVFARTKFSKAIYEQAARKFVASGGGAFSHPVGMTVHDDGDYVNGPLKPGQVFSLDPQIRVPEENLYFRYEDVLVITEKGYENFTDFLPTRLEDIERLAGAGGILQKVSANPGTH